MKLFYLKIGVLSHSRKKLKNPSLLLFFSAGDFFPRRGKSSVLATAFWIL
jgi:hypothetical protein